MNTLKPQMLLKSIKTNTLLHRKHATMAQYESIAAKVQ